MSDINTSAIVTFTKVDNSLRIRVWRSCNWGTDDLINDWLVDTNDEMLERINDIIDMLYYNPEQFEFSV